VNVDKSGSNQQSECSSAVLIWQLCCAVFVFIFDVNYQYSITSVCIAVLNYQNFACSAALPGSGTNREYALHLLQMCNGRIKVVTSYFLFCFLV
jgi:hypothetical protein